MHGMAIRAEPDLKKTWKRVLYEKQAYPDDHVDDTFLESLVTNGENDCHASQLQLCTPRLTSSQCN
jgi:hypothetical protein